MATRVERGLDNRGGARAHRGVLAGAALSRRVLRNLLRGAYEIVDRGNREVASVVSP